MNFAFGVNKLQMFLTKVLEEKKSKHNGHISVVWSIGLGTYIQAGNLTQSGGIVQTIWKQTLRKVKRNKRDIKNVLILGLGGGSVVKLISKNWPTASITGVDIDCEIVELGIKYLKLDAGKVKIIIGDAANIPSQKFDLVLVDLYNGQVFPKKFETKNYIQLIRTVLLSGGVVVFNRLSYKGKMEEANKFKIRLQSVFKNVEAYRPTTNIMFVCSDHVQ